MITRYMDGDAAAEMLERRWFAMNKRTEEMRAECEALREAVAAAEIAWKRACSELAELEALRDALGDQLSHLDEHHPEPIPQISHRPVMSAA
jgi:chromosome segregation ATPase